MPSFLRSPVTYTSFPLSKDLRPKKPVLSSGDFIEYIDNKATRDISLYDARQLVNGDAGSTVTMRVLRVGEKPQTIKVVRGTFKVPVAESRIEAGRIGVVKVYSLEDGEGNDIRGTGDKS